MITGLVRDLLVRHFAAPEQIETPDLRGLIWAGDETTGVLIESVYRWRGELVEKRPALLIKRNRMSNLRFGIGNALGADPRGQRQFVTFWVGSHTVFCLHGTGAGTEILATEVQRELTQFAPQIAADLGLHRWTVTDVDAVSEFEESREGFAVPVTIAWCYEEAWTLEQEAPKLRAVALSTLLDWRRFDSVG